MVWIKEIGASGGADGGWRGDFPLDHELPEEIAVDCQRLRLPIHPMFFVRLRVFAEWHRAEGRKVEIMPPTDPLAKQVFQEMEADPGDHSTGASDAVVGVSRLQEFDQVETISARTKEILEYQLTDVSILGEATFMAVSELCGNAIDHGYWRPSPRLRVLRDSGIRFDGLPPCRADEPALSKRILPSSTGSRTAEDRGFPSSQI